jgi:hypothetical protein
VTGLDFAHARQVVRMTRWRQFKGKPASRETVDLVTDLDARAGPHVLNRLARTTGRSRTASTTSVLRGSSPLLHDVALAGCWDQFRGGSPRVWCSWLVVVHDIQRESGSEMRAFPVRLPSVSSQTPL